MAPSLNHQARNRALIVAGVLGVLVSTYALYVELSAEHKPDFIAMCDINEYASCSRVLTSKYSKGFGILPIDSIPNCVIGTLYYCLMIILSTFDNSAVVRVQYILSLLGVLTSVYLAGILIFILHDVCIVCISTYIVNGALAFITSKKLNAVKKRKSHTS